MFRARSNPETPGSPGGAPRGPARADKSSSSHAPTPHSAAFREPGREVKRRAGWGLSFVVVSAIGCIGQANQGLIGLMVSAPGRKGESEVKDGKVLSKLTRAFFTSDQAGAFSAAYTQREAERTRLASARLQEREGRRPRPHSGCVAIHASGIGRRSERSSKYGHRSCSCSTTSGTAALGNRPATEWLPIASLTAESP
jgi:hypothetical protein